MDEIQGNHMPDLGLLSSWNINIVPFHSHRGSDLDGKGYPN